MRGQGGAVEPVQETAQGPEIPWRVPLKVGKRLGWNLQAARRGAGEQRFGMIGFRQRLQRVHAGGGQLHDCP